MVVRCCICSLVVALSLQAQVGRGVGRGPGSQGAGQPPPPASDCAVSGTVVNAMTGEPIARAMVSLNGADGMGAATDAQGQWKIVNTTCGMRVASAERAGFAAGNLGQASPESRPRLQLVSGSPVTDVRIKLMPESSIAGKVQDGEGDPIEGAQIRLMRVMLQAGKRVLGGGGGTTSDSQGNFLMGRLLPGRVIVCASSRAQIYPVGGGAPMVYEEDCFPGPESSGPSVAMPVEAGREARVSFTLRPVRAVHVRGTVSGLPASGPQNVLRGQVNLVRASGGGVQSTQGGGVRKDGTFDLSPVPPGSYTLRASAQGPQTDTGIPQAEQTIEVGDSDVNDVAIELRPPGSITGTVRFAWTNPDNATATKPDIQVNLNPAAAQGGGFIGRIPRAEWDAGHMNFTFAGVPVGQFQFNAGVNSQTAYVKSADLRGQDVLERPFTVDGDTGPVEIVVSDDLGGVDITVNDAGGQPAPSGTVVMILSASGMRRFVQVGDDGHATNTSIPAGDYRAWAFTDFFNSVPYAEDAWMSENAGPGEKITVATAGNATATIKVISVPVDK